MIASKRLLGLACYFYLATCIGSLAELERLTIFACVEMEFKISSRAVGDFPGENGVVTIKGYRPGDRIGEVKLDRAKITDLYNQAVNHDSSQDPLLGPGVEWLLKDAEGSWYHVYYENHKENPKFMRGRRVALDRLLNVSAASPVLFLSEAQGGYSFNPELLGVLTSIWVEQEALRKEE
jgi:hypothetical protein